MAASRCSCGTSAIEAEIEEALALGADAEHFDALTRGVARVDRRHRAEIDDAA